jgi:hypothetical protein
MHGVKADFEGGDAAAQAFAGFKVEQKRAGIGLQGAELSKASAELGIDYRVLAQDPAERWQLPRAEVLPVTYIVGPDGVLRERLLGEQTAAGLQARLAQLQEGEH